MEEPREVADPANSVLASEKVDIKTDITSSGDSSASVSDAQEQLDESPPGSSSSSTAIATCGHTPSLTPPQTDDINNMDETSDETSTDTASNVMDSSTTENETQHVDSTVGTSDKQNPPVLDFFSGLFRGVGAAADARNDARLDNNDGVDGEQPALLIVSSPLAEDKQEDVSEASEEEGYGAKSDVFRSKDERGAQLSNSHSFAATVLCASFQSEDDEEEEDPHGWNDNSPLRKKAAVEERCCIKKTYLKKMAYVVLLAAFLGIGIVIGMYLPTRRFDNFNSTSETTDNTKVTTSSSPPTIKTASTPTFKTTYIPTFKPTYTPTTATTKPTTNGRPNTNMTANTEYTISEENGGAAPIHPMAENTSYPDVNSTIPASNSSNVITSLSGNATGVLPKEPTILPIETSLVPVETDPLAYEPGNLMTLKNGILLSKGLDCKIIAKAKQPVKYADGKSTQSFHERPDFGATFPTQNGGWVYVSNSEVDKKKGGVGAVYFNKQGKVVDYKMLLRETSMNCGGGRTPWQTWISCEEIAKDGQIWEVDPLGIRSPQQTVLGGNSTGGRFESFTYDVRNKTDPRFYYTEDRPDGPLRRFRPRFPDWTKPHKMLHGEGEIEYLVLSSTSSDNATGTYEWTRNKTVARTSAAAFFPGSEGIDAYDGRLYFVAKKVKMMYILNLDGNTWERRSTQNGAFDGGPDQLTRLVGEQEILYFTEEGGKDAGIHGRDSSGRFYTILESPVYQEETTGLSFSPDHMRLYVAYQVNGLLLDIWRKDGKPFSAKSLNIKYHNTATSNVVRR